MKKQLFGALIYHRNIISEKKLDPNDVTVGADEKYDFNVEFSSKAETPYHIFRDGKLCLHRDMTASLSVGGCVTRAGQRRKCVSCSDDIESWNFGDDDWVIINIRNGLDLLFYYKDAAMPAAAAGSSLIGLSQALESPFARALVLSFALHTALIFFAGLSNDPVESFIIKQRETRWVEMVSNVEELQEEEKPEEEIPVIEDVDNVIIDDSLKDMDRPKIDDTESPIANLDKVEKPVGIQAALGGTKLHDMESLFGSTAGLGDALDFMPETAEGDAFGTGAGFGAGLSGVGFGGGGGGGGGYGTGIGGIGGQGGKPGGTKVSGPKKSKVKQKPKLALDVPKQGAFCKESNIRDVVQKRANALRNCYEQQLLANPELSGKIIVFWKIGLDGKVSDASIKSTTMNNKRVEACLTKTIRRLRFDKPDGGICVVEFPFIFTSAK